MSKISSWVSGRNIKNSPIGYSNVQKFINYTFSILVDEKTAGNVLRRLGHNQKTCMIKTADLPNRTSLSENTWNSLRK